MSISNFSTVNASTSGTAWQSQSLIAMRPAAYYTWLACSLVICIVVSIILLLLLVTSIHQNSLHTGSRILLVHLMLIQLIICAVFFPMQFEATHHSIVHQDAPHVECQSFILFFISTCFAENWSSVIMAFNRFVAIILPHSYIRCLTKRALTVSILLPWLIGFAISIPTYFGVGAELIWNPKNGVCFTKKKSEVYVTAWFAVGVYCPMALMGVTYSALFLRLITKRRAVKVQSRANVSPASLRVGASVSARPTVRCRNAERRRHVQIAKMLMMSFVWYCLCFIPSPVVTTNFTDLYMRDAILQLWLGRTLSLFGYAASPVSIL